MVHTHPPLPLPNLHPQPLDFRDLADAFPDLGRGLQQLLEFDGDVEGVFCRTFTADYDFYGEMRTQVGG